MSLIGVEDWLVLDLETTGLTRPIEPVEVAVVTVLGECLFESLVRPRGRVEQDAEALHGINAAALASAPTFAEIARPLASVLRRRTVASYNAKFDRSVLWGAFAAAGQPAPRCRWSCVAQLAERHHGRLMSLRRVAVDLLQESRGDHHRALVDARLAARVLLDLKHRLSVLPRVATFSKAPGS